MKYNCFCYRLTAFVAKTFSEAKEFSQTLQSDPSDMVCSAVTWLMRQKRGNFFFDNIGLPHLWSLKVGLYQQLTTVKVEIFAQYIFSRILRSVLGARKYDVSEKLNHYSANRINC